MSCAGTCRSRRDRSSLCISLYNRFAPLHSSTIHPQCPTGDTAPSARNSLYPFLLAFWNLTNTAFKTAKTMPKPSGKRTQLPNPHSELASGNGRFYSSPFASFKWEFTASSRFTPCLWRRNQIAPLLRKAALGRHRRLSLRVQRRKRLRLRVPSELWCRPRRRDRIPLAQSRVRVAPGLLRPRESFARPPVSCVPGWVALALG